MQSLVNLNLNLEAVIQIVLLVVIAFCVWQQFQLRNQRAEIMRLEAQVDILVMLQDPDKQPSPTARGVMWQKLVSLRRPKSP